MPAEASIRLVPAMGMLRGSKTGMEAQEGMIKIEGGIIIYLYGDHNLI